MTKCEVGKLKFEPVSLVIKGLIMFFTKLGLNLQRKKTHRNSNESWKRENHSMFFFKLKKRENLRVK